MSAPGALMPAGFERLEVEANGLAFAVRVAGVSGARPVMLLHGFPETSWCWRGIMGTLAEAGMRAVAPDQRGYSPGARPPNTEDYALPNLVADAMALADVLDMQTFDLVGHDWGGMLAWVMAAQSPERVRSLAVVSTPHPGAMRAALSGADPDQAKRSSYISLFRKPEEPERMLLGDDGSGRDLRDVFVNAGMPDAAVDEYVPEYLGVLLQPGALTAALNWYRALDASEVSSLPPVMVPTLYVWSTGDLALGRVAAEATAEYVAGSYKFVVLNGVSHWIPEEAPEELGRLLLDHLAAH